MSRLFNIRFACGGRASCWLAGAVNTYAQMSAPVVGWIAGQGPRRNEIQAIVGVMGASTVQPPLSLSGDILRVHLAPAGGWALVEQRGQTPGSIGLMDLTKGAVQSIGGVSPNPLLVSFSPTGKSAALEYRSGSIQVLTGLDGSPQVSFQTEFTDPSGVRAIAVSDDGSAVAALTGRRNGVLARQVVGAATRLYGLAIGRLGLRAQPVRRRFRRWR
ncbi:MAG: hypothetical protein WDO73_29900 [Ignavibacteriota bacterium]